MKSREWYIEQLTRLAPNGLWADEQRQLPRKPLT